MSILMYIQSYGHHHNQNTEHSNTIKYSFSALFNQPLALTLETSDLLSVTVVCLL